MSHPFFGNGGPIILSLYDAFFMGGSRIVHTEIVRNLNFTTNQRHSVLSLTDRVTREFTTQTYETSTPYLRLKSSGIPAIALDRENTSPWLSSDLTIVDQMVRGSDVILSLKEQPLPALSFGGTHGKPLFVTLHRSDPENQGEGAQDLIDLCEAGLLTKAICCSQSTLEAYHRIGIPREKLAYVPNGIDLQHFKRSPLQRTQMRDRLGIRMDAPVVIIAARFDLMKNVDLFVETARRFLKRDARAHFILCGAGMDRSNEAFEGLLEGHGVSLTDRERFHAMGIQSEMAPFYNASDLVVLTSTFGEAAPLCLLEGMATGAIPVTTAVGDSALMVGDPHLVTAPDPDEMLEKWCEAYANRSEHRERIMDRRMRLSDQNMFDSYYRLLSSAY